MPSGKCQAITYHDNGAIETTFEANRMSFRLLFLTLLSNAYTLAQPPGQKSRHGKVKNMTSIDNDSVVPTFINSNRKHLQ